MSVIIPGVQVEMFNKLLISRAKYDAADDRTEILTVTDASDKSNDSLQLYSMSLFQNAFQN